MEEKKLSFIKYVQDAEKIHKQDLEQIYHEEKLEETDISDIEKRIVQPLSFRHRDLFSLIRDVHKKLKKQEKDTEDLEAPEEFEDIEKIVYFYKDIFDDQKEIDADFTVSIFTLAYILRFLEKYYQHRLSTIKDFEVLGNEMKGSFVKDAELRKEIEYIMERNNRTKPIIQSLLNNISKIIGAEGNLIASGRVLKNLSIEEGFSGWEVRKK